MNRKTGIVIPLSSLYTKECPDVGDYLALKPFADFCKKSDINIIQLLPVNDTGTQSSPYSGLSAFALHPLYIRIEALDEFEDAMANDKTFASHYKSYKKEFIYQKRFDYEKVLNKKNELLHLLYAYIEKRIAAEEKKSDSKVNTVTASSKTTFAQDFYIQTEKFVMNNDWVIPYAVYKNLKDDHMQSSWKEWPKNLQDLTMEQIRLRWNNKALKSSHRFFVWCQMRAAEQFKESCDYCSSLSIIIKGDIPILMNEDSADTWAYKDYFNHNLRAGSPPDGETPMGQNWGFPTYQWDNLEKDNYSWWKDRISTASQYYSAFRIDHILGFFRIWAVNHLDTTAYLGYTIPCSTFTTKNLNEKGFDDNRIKWLSKPHIPTRLIEDITWNHDEAVSILSQVCDRIGNEELWNFNKKIKGDRMLYDCHFSDDSDKDIRIKNALSAKWRDRTLIEVKKNHYVQIWKYYESTAWNTLSDAEKSSLSSLFAIKDANENKLWKKQALNVLTPITKQSSMTPCAEDLGVNLEVMPEVLNKLNILSLKVLRWTRLWQEPYQPYVQLKDFPELSVCTTSVHDSPTLRQWWNNEKDSVSAYISMWNNRPKDLFTQEESIDASQDFNAQTARFVLESAAHTNSQWFINPLQDYLYLDQSYYMDNPDDERINVPGTVNEFNWTYRIPVSIEDLLKNIHLSESIANIAKIHDNL